MFNLFSPYFEITHENPVFQFGHQRLRLLKTSQGLRRFNKFVWLGIPAVILLWWLIERANVGFGHMPSAMEWNLSAVVLYLSLGLMPLSSLWTMSVTIAQVHRSFHSDEWDVLRLTHLYEVEILDARDALAQIRAWALPAIEVGMRLATVCLFVLTWHYNTYQMTSNKSMYFMGTFLSLFCWAYFGLLFGIGVAYVFEPILRMRLIVALSTTVALKIRSLNFALLAGFTAVLSVHVIQSVMFSTLWYIYQAISRDDDYGVGILCIFTPLLLMAAGIYYAVYVGIRRISRAYTLHRSVTAE